MGTIKVDCEEFDRLLHRLTEQATNIEKLLTSTCDNMRTFCETMKKFNNNLHSIRWELQATLICEEEDAEPGLAKKKKESEEEEGVA